MKCRVAISVLTIILSMLISGCVSVKSCFVNDYATGYNLYRHPGNKSFSHSSNTLKDSDNSMLNLKKNGLKLSISFPPSAKLEF
jgi:hypothetical protein